MSDTETIGIGLQISDEGTFSTSVITYLCLGWGDALGAWAASWALSAATSRSSSWTRARSRAVSISRQIEPNVTRG